VEDCVRCERWCHVLGAWDAPCYDKELRQWKLCVTFSASPMTVTHAWEELRVGADWFVVGELPQR
jgi:hypothetical protein